MTFILENTISTHSLPIWKALNRKSNAINIGLKLIWVKNKVRKNSYCLGSCRLGIGHAWMCHLSDQCLYFMLGRSIQCNWTYLKLSLNVSDIFNYWPLRPWASLNSYLSGWIGLKRSDIPSDSPVLDLNWTCLNGPSKRFNCLWLFWIAIGKLELPIAAFKLPWKLLNRKWMLMNT